MKECRDMDQPLCTPSQEGAALSGSHEGPGAARVSARLREQPNLHEAEPRGQNEELRQVQEELRSSHDRYFRLYDLAPVGYLTTDSDGKIREINLTGAEMLRRSRFSLIGTRVAALVRPLDLPILDDHRSRVFRFKDRNTCEIRLNPQPEEIWMQVTSTPLLDREGKVDGILSAFLDITGRKQLEEKLAKFHRRDLGFADGAPDMIVMMDRGLRFSYVNPAVERHLGIAVKEFLGKTPEQMGMPSDFCGAWNEALRSVVASGEVRTLEFEYPFTEGSKHFLACLVPDTRDPGLCESIVAFVRDFTALRNAHSELEKEVRQRTAELERVNVEMRNEIAQREKFEKALQFSTTQIIEHSRRRKYLSKRLVELLEQDRRDVAMALHDQIGQVLTTLKMNLELLRGRVSQEETRAIIESAIEKASQAMSFSRNISQELRPAMLDTLGLVPSIENLIAQVKDSSGLAITFFHKGISGKLKNEKELALYRILQEALTNIMKHASARAVHVTLIRKENSILLTIEDDGKGFEYRRLTSSEKGPLGIMIMRERAVQVGGNVNIDSRPGKGTHVAARVPVQEEL